MKYTNVKWLAEDQDQPNRLKNLVLAQGEPITTQVEAVIKTAEFVERIVKLARKHNLRGVLFANGTDTTSEFDAIEKALTATVKSNGAKKKTTRTNRKSGKDPDSPFG